MVLGLGRHTTPGKKSLFKNFIARTNGGAHENRDVKSPSQLRRERSTRQSSFSLVNALEYVDID